MAPAVRKAQRKRGDYQQGNKGCRRPWKRRISARIFDENVLEDTVIATISIRKGVPGIMQGFRDLIAEYGADLFVTVDIGADAFSPERKHRYSPR